MMRRIQNSNNATEMSNTDLINAELPDCHNRLAEIAEILAIGLQRALARKSSEVCADCGESSLHILPGQSVHPTPVDRRTPDG
jgi:hypothetical protein